MAEMDYIDIRYIRSVHKSGAHTRTATFQKAAMCFFSLPPTKLLSFDSDSFLAFTISSAHPGSSSKRTCSRHFDSRASIISKI